MSNKNVEEIAGVRLKVLNVSLSEHVKPKEIQDKSKDWVLNGIDNGYFGYVNDRYNGSPTNSAIINGYTRLIYGGGLGIRRPELNSAKTAKIAEVLKPKDVKRIAGDFYKQGMSYVQLNEKRNGDLSKIQHLTLKYVAPEKEDKDGVINAFFFSKNWKMPKGDFEPKRYKSFGSDGKGTKIAELRPYNFDSDYFGRPSYKAGLQYAELEEEISNFAINHIKNGLSFGFIVNVPNGMQLSEEQKDEIERKIKKNLTGSNNAGMFVIDFSDTSEDKITVEAVEINDSHKQYEFLSGHAREQLITSHEVVSPMLFGIKDANGFSSNADELDVAEKQVLKRVIRPMQQEIIDFLEEILMHYGIDVELYFKPLKEVAEDTEETETATEENTQLSKHSCCLSKDYDKKKDIEVAEELICFGEDEDLEEWVCISEMEVDYDIDDELTEDANRIANSFVNLASTGTARSNAKSEQDSELFKIRYQYAPLRAGENSREFCKKMVAAKKIYRKEDIIRMGSQSVNAGWGLNGADNYSIWLYKGGGGCHHKWLRKTYVKKNGNVDVLSPLAEVISTAEARRRGDRTRNEKEVSMRPVDMPNKGFVNK